MVVAAYDVAEGRKALFYPLDLDRVGYRITEVLEFLVGGGCGNEKTLLVSINSSERLITRALEKRTLRSIDRLSECLQ